MRRSSVVEAKGSRVDFLDSHYRFGDGLPLNLPDSGGLEI